MRKTNKFKHKKYVKHLDINIILQAIFGLAAVLCAVISCAIAFSPSSLFNMLKDIFKTAMVFVVFIVAIRHLKKITEEKIDKLDYLDNWEEYKSEIYTCEDISMFDKHLLYGIQAATYTEDESKKLYNRIDYVLKEKQYSNAETENILLCVQAILEVFNKTKRLTLNLEEKDFKIVSEKLCKAYEEKISDSDLAAWCKILRNDKLELSLELYAATLKGAKKVSVLNEALDKCKECIVMLDDQVLRNKNDKYFALFYRAYSNRNISQIYRQLSELESKPEYIEKEESFRIKTLNDRKELYNYYCMQYKSNSMTRDYIDQEYILSLAEQCQFVKDQNKKDMLIKEVNLKYNQWKTQYETRNMLFNKIKAAVNALSK